MLSALLPAGGHAADTVDIKAWLAAATLKVFPDTVCPGDNNAPFRIVAVRNEYAPFQVAVSSSKGSTEITVVVTGLTGEEGFPGVSPGSMLLVENVPVERPSIINGRSGAKKGPALWPDPLPPLRPFHLGEGETRAAWIDLFIPAGAKPGLYKGVVVVSSAAGVRVELPFTVDVRNITLPLSPGLRTAFGNRSLASCAKKAHGIGADDPGYQTLLEEYYWFLVEHRLSPYHIPVDIYSPEAHRFLDDPRVTFFVVPVDQGFEGSGTLWDDGEMKRLGERLEKTGWIDKGAFYLIDEPTPEMAKDVVRTGRRIHSINPRFRYLMTPHSGGILSNERVMNDAHVGIWVPLVTLMSLPAERTVLLEQQRQGKELWWYTCVVPKWRGMNYFIDESATAPRLHPWMSHLYGITGILYWSTDNWTAVDCDPWNRTETFPTGNGDGSLLYPGRQGRSGPVASIRLKMLREGLEDYELLKLLGERLRKAADTIGGEAALYRPEKRLFEHAFALVTEEGRSSLLGEDTPYLKYLTRDYRDIERRRALVIDEVETALEAPLLLVTTFPSDNGYTFGDFAVVYGYATPGSGIEVNGIKTDLKGNSFSTAVPVLPGKNVVTIKATDSEGRTKTVERTINRHRPPVEGTT